MSHQHRQSILSRATAQSDLNGLTRRMVAQGLLSSQQAIDAEATAVCQGISILRHLTENGLVKPSDAATVAGWEFGLPVIDLEAINISFLPPISDYPVNLLRLLTVLPLARCGRTLTVAVPCPATLAELDELQFVTGFRIEGVLAPFDQLKDTLEDYLAQSEASMMEEFEDVDESVSALNFSQADDPADVPLAELEAASEDAPIVRFVNKILLDALRRGASDIHFEPYESRFRVRFRVDGMLIEIASPPFSLRNRIAARLKIMARMDISERRLPQDGAIKLQLSHSHSLDFRVNSLPTVYGEKIVMRLLDPTNAQREIDSLGFTDTQREHYEKALEQPQGIILVTGPTGSGKTVSLYAGINILNQTQRNICTAEDPVEIRVPGINQVNVLPKIGLDFAQALRAFLRQDPDVIMVGEIRDLETADIAIKASQTGHLVLSTVHTNTAAETLTRLSNMGVSTFNIASAVSLIIAQRLARKLCNHCKTPIKVPDQALSQEGFSDDQIARATLYSANGCKQCTQGYKGRTGIYEVVPIGDELSELIMRDANTIDINRQMRQQGHLDLRTSGLIRVMDGITSLEEINRITRD